MNEVRTVPGPIEKTCAFGDTFEKAHAHLDATVGDRVPADLASHRSLILLRRDADSGLYAF
jgi:hypothetical protein